MISVRVLMRADGCHQHEVDGFTPSASCPLAVTKLWYHSERKWIRANTWCIVHRPTGKTLGAKEWMTMEAAFAILLKCDPDFPAWPLAKGFPDDPATAACKYKFRVACCE